MSIPALISFSSGHQRHLEFDVIVSPGANANGIAANDDRRRPLIIDPRSSMERTVVARDSTMQLQWLLTHRDTEARCHPQFHHVFFGQLPCIERRVT